MVVTWGWMHKSSAVCNKPEEVRLFSEKGPNFLLRKKNNIASGKCEAANLMENSQNLEHSS